jgi:23S rRNA (guanosine2251-2'-O)-methyltransferase
MCENYNRLVVEAGRVPAESANGGTPVIIARMRTSGFQFRVCQNPDCGLRYPLTDRSSFGQRCPICLGTTVVTAGGKLGMEQATSGAHNMAAGGWMALVDNVRSAWNVGSIFRSAEGFAVEHLYLCGITPTPDNPSVKKTALGAQETVGWSAHRNAVALVEELRVKGAVILALEKTTTSQEIESALQEHRLNAPCMLVVGNEQAGIDPGILDLADQVVHVEMQGRKRSFNVAIAFSIAAFAISKQLERQRSVRTPLITP